MARNIGNKAQKLLLRKWSLKMADDRPKKEFRMTKKGSLRRYVPDDLIFLLVPPHLRRMRTPAPSRSPCPSCRPAGPPPCDASRQSAGRRSAAPPSAARGRARGGRGRTSQGPGKRATGKLGRCQEWCFQREGADVSYKGCSSFKFKLLQI